MGSVQRLPIAYTILGSCQLLAALAYRAAAKASGDGGVRMLNRRTFAATRIARMTKAA